MNTIITHLNPDLDAMASVWLLKRFLPGWKDAEVKFVPAGINSKLKTKNLKQKTSIEELYVDTGFGILDHHQTDKKTCAAVLTWNYISKKYKVKGKNDKNNQNKIEAINRLVAVVLRIDYFAEDITTFNAADDFYAFLFNERQIIRGIRAMYRGQSDKQMEIGAKILDAIYEVLKAKIEAESVIESGVKFETKWGKGVGANTNNEMYMHLAQEIGYKVVVSKDPKKGHIRIHALPKSGIDFSKLYVKLKSMDCDATWYLHPSKALLLNGSSANPDMKPTKMKLEEVILVIKNIK